MGVARAGQGSHGTVNQSSAFLIKNSLRFDGSSYLLWTPSSTGDSVRKWTISLWVKQNYATGGTAKYMISAGPSTGSDTAIYPYTYDLSSNISGKYYFVQGDSTRYVRSVPSYRDESAWYHMVFQSDADNATTGDKLKIFVNGERITTDIPGNAPITQNTYWNSANPHRIARIGNTTNWTGYMAEFHSVDNQLVDPSYFGFTDPLTNTWRPKKYEGTYGTNGFYLDFSDFSDLGADRSGNGNNFTPTGFTADDVVLDSPSGVVFSSAPTSGITTNNSGPSNYATLNPIFGVGRQSSQTYSDGNLKVVSSATSGFDTTAVSTLAVKGKIYCEFTLPSDADGVYTGVMKANTNLTVNGIDTTASSDCWLIRSDTGNKANGDGGSGASYGSAFSNGDVMMMAVDIDNTSIWWGKNGSWFASGNPATNSNAAFTNLPSTDDVLIMCGDNYSTRTPTIEVNFGQKDFSYTPPSGFLPLCTANLLRPTEAAVRPDKYFNTIIYTGASPSDKVVTGVGFAPDFVWIKARTQAYSHALYDTVRGATKELHSDTTDAEDTDTNGLKSFGSDGFTVGSDGEVGDPTGTRVAWCWKAGGAAVSNTDGSITSQVSVNQDAGFSIVSHTGNTTAGATVGHGLAVAPSMIILKNRDTADHWPVYHASLGATKALLLTDTGAESTSSVWWNNTTPTSTVFSLGTGTTNYADAYIAYCFAEVEGYSKMSSWTGNGSTDGPFIFTGFRPSFLLFKRSNLAEDWVITDSVRRTYNQMNGGLRPNSNAIEWSTDDVAIDFTSNGFKIRSADAKINASGSTYVFMALAEAPTNNLFGGQANAR